METKPISKKKYFFVLVLLLVSVLTNMFCVTTVLVHDTQNIDNLASDTALQAVTIDVKVSEDMLGNPIYGHGSGSLITTDGEILTNKHLVQDDNGIQYSEFIVKFIDSSEAYNAKLFFVCEIADLAILKIDKETKCFKLGNANDVYFGDKIYTWGNPNNFGLAFAEGTVSGINRVVILNEKEIQTLQLDININNGNSGGPVFNKKGELIGLISFRMFDSYGEIINGLGFAVPIDVIKDFLTSIK